VFYIQINPNRLFQRVRIFLLAKVVIDLNNLFCLKDFRFSIILIKSQSLILIKQLLSISHCCTKKNTNALLCLFYL